MGYNSENMPSDPKPATTRLNELLTEYGIDIKHPALADFSKWLDTATNDEIANINRCLMSFSLLDVKLTPELLGKTWEKLARIIDIAEFIYNESYGPSVQIDYTEVNGEFICSRKENPAELPSVFIDLIIAYLQVGNQDLLKILIQQHASLLKEYKRLSIMQKNDYHALAPEITEVASEGDERDQQELSNPEKALILGRILERDWILLNILPAKINENKLAQSAAKNDSGATFALWHMHKQNNVDLNQNRILTPEQQPKQIPLTPETGAIVPYMPRCK